MTKMDAREIVAECWTCSYRVTYPGKFDAAGVWRGMMETVHPDLLTAARAVYHRQHDHDVRPIVARDDSTR